MNQEAACQVEVIDRPRERRGHGRGITAAQLDLVIRNAVDPSPAQTQGHRPLLPIDTCRRLEFRQGFAAGQAKGVRSLIEQIGQLGNRRNVETIQPGQGGSDIDRALAAEQTETDLKPVIDAEIAAARFDLADVGVQDENPTGVGDHTVIETDQGLAERAVDILYLSLADIIVGFAGLGFAAVGIRCPRCNVKWMWLALKEQRAGASLSWLLCQASCPACGARFTAGNSKGKS